MGENADKTLGKAKGNDESVCVGFFCEVVLILDLDLLGTGLCRL